MARSVGSWRPATADRPYRRAQAAPAAHSRGRRGRRRHAPRPLAPRPGQVSGYWKANTAMTTESVNPPDLARPSGFSHAVIATGGRLVFLAGQTALDGSGAIVG